MLFMPEMPGVKNGQASVCSFFLEAGSKGALLTGIELHVHAHA